MLPAAPISTLTDEELLHRIARPGAPRDRTAMTLLYTRHHRRLLGVGIAVLRSLPEAEDITQDVFVKAFASAGRYDPRFGRASAWLTTMMRNACIDRLRRQSHERQIRDDLRLAPSAASNPSFDGARAIEGSRAVDAMLRLPEVQRLVVREVYLEGFTCSEVADRERLALGTVKSRAARALATLRGDLMVDAA